MKRLLFVFVVATAVALACAPALALKTPIIIESNLWDGEQNSLFYSSGLTRASRKSSAAPLAGWAGGELMGAYSFVCTEASPAKYGEWLFRPMGGEGGYYDVYATWLPGALASLTAPTWTINSESNPVSLSLLQMYGSSTWNLLATGLKYNEYTSYTARLTSNPDGGTRQVYFDSVAWVASNPGAVINTGIANGSVGIAPTGTGNSLSWMAGACNSAFDVFLGTDLTKVAAGDASVRVATNLSGTISTFDPDTLGGLAGQTTYFWMVQAKNLDAAPVNGAVWSFSTVPEPGSLVALATGLLFAVPVVMRRRK